MLVAVVFWAVPVAAGSLAQTPTDPADAAAIRAARQALVAEIDPSLPRVPFEEWLRGLVGSDATMKWEVNDCGEQTGDPNQDRGRDFPMCAEVAVGLGDQRELRVSFSVGTFQKGVTGVTTFRSAYVREADNPPQWIKGLAAVPPAIRQRIAPDPKSPNHQISQSSINPQSQIARSSMHESQNP